MKSFGIWYKNEKSNGNKPLVELHINLWNIENSSKKIIEPFIDFGMIIENFREINEILFLFPFVFEDGDFIDLYDKVRDSETARLIFNDSNCDTSSVKDFHYLKNTEDNKDKLILQLKKNKTFENGVSCISKDEDGEEYTILTINFDDLKKDSNCYDFVNLYFRFRIESEKLKKEIFCPLKKKNNFLESGFTATQIIDMKINKERNIPKGICKKNRRDGFEFIGLKKVHFLVMDRANNEVSVLGNDFIECRKLEINDWDKYLDQKYNSKDVLVYHWKQSIKEDSKENVKEYGKLVKITTATTNWRMIIIYILAAIVIGAAGNLLYSAACWIKDMLSLLV